MGLSNQTGFNQDSVILKNDRIWCCRFFQTEPSVIRKKSGFRAARERERVKEGGFLSKAENFYSAHELLRCDRLPVCQCDRNSNLLTPGLSGVWDQNRVNSPLYIAFWSVEPTDFKNVIVENIPPALFEDAEVTEVKRPRNSKRRKLYYEKW